MIFYQGKVFNSFDGLEDELEGRYCSIRIKDPDSYIGIGRLISVCNYEAIIEVYQGTEPFRVTLSGWEKEIIITILSDYFLSFNKERYYGNEVKS